MKDAGCDPISPGTDQDHEDSETETGMTAALFAASPHCSRHNALQCGQVQCSIKHRSAVHSSNPISLTFMRKLALQMQEGISLGSFTC